MVCHEGDSPSLLNSSHAITASITAPEGGAEGVILDFGGRFCGYGFEWLKGKPVFLWNMIDLERIKWEGTDARKPGKHSVAFAFKVDGLSTGMFPVGGKVVVTKKWRKPSR